jgi:hypothetical protein
MQYMIHIGILLQDIHATVTFPLLYLSTEKRCEGKYLRLRERKQAGKGEGSVVSVHAMKAYSGSRGTVPFILNLSTRLK